MCELITNMVNSHFIVIHWRWKTGITVMKLSSTSIILSTPILSNQNTLYIEHRLAVSPTRLQNKTCLKSCMPGQPDQIIYMQQGWIFSLLNEHKLLKWKSFTDENSVISRYFPVQLGNKHFLLIFKKDKYQLH